MAVKIKLKRMGAKRNPQYRIIIADSRTRRDGRAIEEIGIYHPKEDPSLIQVNSERAQYWLGVGAQPTEAVQRLLEITGDWQTFKGLPGAEGTLKVAEAPADKKAVFAAAVAEGQGEKERFEQEQAEKAKADAAAKAKAAKDAAEAKAAEEAKADEAPAEAKADAPADTEAAGEAEAPAAEQAEGEEKAEA